MTLARPALSRVLVQRIREAAQAAKDGGEVRFRVRPIFEEFRLVWNSSRQMGITHVIAGGTRKQMEDLMPEVLREFETQRVEVQ